ncbi:tetratricopeptide repeat protein (plasmid) [Deinococcus psychrotolerans]|uniref:Tetratricopeptide repeat protein n=1 Tax=Deinococcus psychrotolerans TaxID=2489213 RepID=A0A3G8YT29_9DEIO|nr:tetratricopeptide repeat protein [Deinococcus psychrotolerans]AZI44851.1 tetratricopeptide repeat protein [Deinococcus psychrotolerans]
MERYGDALEAAAACLKVQVDDDPELDAMACQNAGDAHFGLGQFAQARAMYLKARIFFERTGNQVATAGIAVALGRVGQRQGAEDEARQLFERSLELQQKTGDRRGQTETLLHLAELLGTSAQPEDALSALHRSGR